MKKVRISLLRTWHKTYSIICSATTDLVEILDINQELHDKLVNFLRNRLSPITHYLKRADVFQLIQK